MRTSGFQTYSPKPLSEVEKAALAVVFDEQLIVKHCDMRTTPYRAGKTQFTGFTGTVTLAYPENASQVLKALGQLSALAFYSSVGAKTPYGMGQVKCVEGEKGRVLKKTRH